VPKPFNQQLEYILQLADNSRAGHGSLAVSSKHYIVSQVNSIIKQLLQRQCSRNFNKGFIECSVSYKVFHYLPQELLTL
jgi:hypothetical protein